MMIGDEARVDRAAPHVGVFEQPKHERDVGANAEDGEGAQRGGGACECRLTCFGECDQLGDQRIVVDADLVPLDDPGIHADAGPAGSR